VADIRRFMLTLSSTMEKTPELFRRRRSLACLFVSSRHSRSVLLLAAATNDYIDEMISRLHLLAVT